MHLGALSLGEGVVCCCKHPIHARHAHPVIVVLGVGDVIDLLDDNDDIVVGVCPLFIQSFSWKLRAPMNCFTCLQVSTCTRSMKVDVSIV